MPETPTKQALLAAIKVGSSSCTIVLAARVHILFPTAARLLSDLEREGAVTARKLGTTYLWTRREPALPQTECENGDLYQS